MDFQFAKDATRLVYKSISICCYQAGSDSFTLSMSPMGPLLKAIVVSAVFLAVGAEEESVSRVSDPEIDLFTYLK